MNRKGYGAFQFATLKKKKRKRRQNPISTRLVEVYFKVGWGYDVFLFFFVFLVGEKRGKKSSKMKTKCPLLLHISRNEDTKWCCTCQY